MKTLSNNTRLFFDYGFKGDGKYYTTEAKSRTYGNTTFQNFYNKNIDCIEILDSGNDAPRGGQTGNFVNVKFNETFYSKYAFVFEAKAEKLEKERLFKKSIPLEKQTIIDFINENKIEVCEKLAVLDVLKSENDRENWQIKANSLVQWVSKNDFRFLKWKEIYNLIRENV